MKPQIIDLRNKIKTKKITIEFIANKPFYAVYKVLDVKGYKILIDAVYSNKNDNYCRIKISVFKKKNDFDDLIDYLANNEFCKKVYIHDYQELNDFRDD